jgi:hypothetical protein
MFLFKFSYRYESLALAISLLTDIQGIAFLDLIILSPTWARPFTWVRLEPRFLQAAKENSQIAIKTLWEIL